MLHVSENSAREMFMHEKVEANRQFRILHNEEFLLLSIYVT